MTIRTKKNTHKMFLVFLMTLILMLTLLITPVTNVVYAADNVTFSDVPISHWGYKYVESLYKDDIIKGYGDKSFNPNGKLTRRHASKMIAIAAGLDHEGKTPSFNDVIPTDEMAPYIGVLEETGAVIGYKDKLFKPEDMITRSQIAQIVVKAFNLEKGSASINFIDKLSNSQSQVYIDILASNGIVKGYEDNRFRPSENITRVQMAKIISIARAVSAVQDAEKEINQENINEAKALVNVLTDDDAETRNSLKNRLDIVQAKLGPRKVVDVSNIDDINIGVDDTYELPKEVRIRLSDKSVVTVPVTWDDTVDIHTAGTYTLLGVLDLSGLKNVTETDKLANIKVVVSEEPLEDKDSNNTTISIMLDPGHGGSDTGARRSGISEKDLNLSVSKKVADSLKNYGYNVLMTRNSDSTLDLYQRALLANEAEVDIFISIHHNAASDTSVSGIETFYYMPKTAYLPRPENAQTHDDPARLEESRKLANSIQKELIDTTDAIDRKVKRASYLVVRETQMPAALLELGFMSNLEELALLKNDDYQNTLVDAIVSGINEYFSN